MSDSYITPDTPSLDKLVNDALSKGGDIGSLFENMKAELREKMGIVNPASENELLYGGRPAAPVVAAPDPSVPRHAYRVVYPFGNMRAELYGVDETDLDQQEEKIRRLYQ
jgi:hypothetical protein